MNIEVESIAAYCQQDAVKISSLSLERSGNQHLVRFSELWKSKLEHVRTLFEQMRLLNRIEFLDSFKVNRCCKKTLWWIKQEHLHDNVSQKCHP